MAYMISRMTATAPTLPKATGASAWAGLRGLLPKAKSRSRRNSRSAGVGDIAGDAMLRAHGGDGAAYREVLRWSSQWLRVYFEYHSPELNAWQVDFAVKETIAAIHAKRHTFTGGRSFAEWLEAVARYKSPTLLSDLRAGASVGAAC